MTMLLHGPPLGSPVPVRRQRPVGSSAAAEPSGQAARRCIRRRTAACAAKRTTGSDDGTGRDRAVSSGGPADGAPPSLESTLSLYEQELQEQLLPDEQLGELEEHQRTALAERVKAQMGMMKKLEKLGVPVEQAFEWLRGSISQVAALGSDFDDLELLPGLAALADSETMSAVMGIGLDPIFREAKVRQFFQCLDDVHKGLTADRLNVPEAYADAARLWLRAKLGDAEGLDAAVRQHQRGAGMLAAPPGSGLLQSAATREVTFAELDHTFFDTLADPRFAAVSSHAAVDAASQFRIMFSRASQLTSFVAEHVASGANVAEYGGDLCSLGVEQFERAYHPEALDTVVIAAKASWLLHMELTLGNFTTAAVNAYLRSELGLSRNFSATAAAPKPKSKGFAVAAVKANRVSEYWGGAIAALDLQRLSAEELRWTAEQTFTWRSRTAGLSFALGFNLLKVLTDRIRRGRSKRKRPYLRCPCLRPRRPPDATCGARRPKPRPEPRRAAPGPASCRSSTQTGSCPRRRASTSSSRPTCQTRTWPLLAPSSSSRYRTPSIRAEAPTQS